MDVLLVCEVHERRVVHIGVRHLNPLSGLFLPLVFPNEGKAEKDENQDLKAVAHEERADAELVRGGLIGFVEERSG